MFVVASMVVLLVEALVVVLLLVGALLRLSFFFLRQPRPRRSGQDPTTRGRAEVRRFPRSPSRNRLVKLNGPRSEAARVAKMR
jgi:hypothetical protein